jgi:hypothetical protein
VPVPVVRFLAAVAVAVDLRFFNPPEPLPPWRGPLPPALPALEGDRLPEPTDVDDDDGRGCGLNYKLIN